MILFASFQVPSRLDWRGDLAQLKPFNRKLLWVQGGFTVLTILAFGSSRLCCIPNCSGAIERPWAWPLLSVFIGPPAFS